MGGCQRLPPRSVSYFPPPPHPATTPFPSCPRPSRMPSVPHPVVFLEYTLMDSIPPPPPSPPAPPPTYTATGLEIPPPPSEPHPRLMFLDKYQKYKYAYKRAMEAKKNDADILEVMYWLEVCDHYLLKCKRFPDLHNDKALFDWAEEYLLTYDDYLIEDVDESYLS
jgi:hypothetical protein